MPVPKLFSKSTMNIATINNCTENGEIFSCFLRIGEVQSTTDCENSCQAKNLFPFQLDDFYNFADRLNQSNFLSSPKALQNGSSEYLKGEFEIYFYEISDSALTMSHDEHYAWVHFSPKSFRSSSEFVTLRTKLNRSTVHFRPCRFNFDPPEYLAAINDHAYAIP